MYEQGVKLQKMNVVVKDITSTRVVFLKKVLKCVTVPFVILGVAHVRQTAETSEKKNATSVKPRHSTKGIMVRVSIWGLCTGQCQAKVL